MEEERNFQKQGRAETGGGHAEEEEGPIAKMATQCQWSEKNGGGEGAE